MDRRAAAGGLLVLMPAGGCLGAPFSGSDGSGTIESLTVEEVALNDDLAGDVPRGEGSGVCAGGPPPDHFLVRLLTTIDDADSGQLVNDDQYGLVVRVGNQSAVDDTTLIDGRSKQVRSLLFVRDDDTVTGGEAVTVAVSLRHDGEGVETLTRTARVTARDPDCVTTGS